MKMFFDWMDEFLASGSIWVYLFIFAGKTLEMTVGTLRIVLINRGEKVKGCLASILEITLWVLIASSVLDGWKQDIIKAVSYILAYAAGNYAGACLDDFLAFGLSSLQIVVPTLEDTKSLANYLQEKGYGVTSIDVKGKDSNKHYMLVLIIKRKNLRPVLDDIQMACPSAMVTVSDVKTVRGGYMRNAGKHRGTLTK